MRVEDDAPSGVEVVRVSSSPLPTGWESLTLAEFGKADELDCRAAFRGKLCAGPLSNALTCSCPGLLCWARDAGQDGASTVPESWKIDEFDRRRGSGFELCAEPIFCARASAPGHLRGSRDAGLDGAAEAGSVLGA